MKKLIATVLRYYRIIKSLPRKKVDSFNSPSKFLEREQLTEGNKNEFDIAFANLYYIVQGNTCGEW